MGHETLVVNLWAGTWLEELDPDYIISEIQEGELTADLITDSVLELRSGR